MRRDPALRTDELVLGPVDAGRGRSRVSRVVPVLVVSVAIAAAAGSSPGLLSGTPTAAPPTPAPPPTDGVPTATWTGSPERAPAGNAFVQSSTRLLRLPAT